MDLRIGLVPVWLVLAIGVVGRSDSRAAPPLEIDLVTPDLADVSWEVTQGVVQFEMSHDLRHWLPVPTVPSLLDGRHHIPVTTAPDRGFFRLRSNAALYIVSQSADFIGFADFETASGNVPPTTMLERGATTMLTQPRAAVVTRSGRLLISRGNGGIVGWNGATRAVGSKPADLEVDGNNTGLDTPISFAYDHGDDILYVGETASAEGILSFDAVSGFGFDGNVAPDRTFGPDDRVPFATSGSIAMTVDAFKLIEDDDTLYVVDTSGSSVNSSRILVFNNASSASGKTNPGRTITGTGSWTKLRSIEIVDDRLYAVDDTAVVFIVDDISSASGNVTPQMVTVEGQGVSLRAVISFDEQLYFLDRSNASFLALDIAKIPVGINSSTSADRAITGSATVMRVPSYMYISQGYLD